MTDDPRDRLTDLGGADVPPPDPVFAERLEHRLRSVATVSPAPAAPPPRRGRWTGLLLRPSVAVAVIALVGIVGATMFGRGDSEGEVLALTAARSSSVVLPDGTELDAVPGLEVPDGAVIEVGPDGSVTIDGVVYAAGSVLEITDGRVHPVTDRPDDQPPARPAPTTTMGPDPGRDPVPVTDRPITPPSTETPPASRPATSVPPASAVDRPLDTRPPTTTVPTTIVVTPAVTLEAVAVAEQRWRLVWAVTGDDAIAGWVVRGPNDRKVAALRDPTQRELVVKPPADAVEVTYSVEARGADGTLLATSNTVTVVVGGG